MARHNRYLDQPQLISEVIDDADQDLLDLLDASFGTWLTIISLSADEAATLFLIDYDIAYTQYTKGTIYTLIQGVASVNAKKYDKLCAAYQAQYDPIQNYDRTESRTDIRTPNLSKATSGQLASTVTLDRDTTNAVNQTRTTTTTPTNYTTTSEHEVAPYDSATYAKQAKDTTVESGSTATTEAYTGDPDVTHYGGTESTLTSSSASETETGTDTTTVASRIYGNIGVTTSQQMLTSELELAGKMVIWKTIERDIAAAICLQVW